MLTKAFAGQVKEVKQENGQGIVVAAFCQFNVVDKDGDVILPGAFGEQKARVQGAHDWNEPNLGVAKVYERGDWAIAEIEYNLEIQSASDRWKSIKFSAERELNIEYSFGYDILEESPEAAREFGAKRGLKKLKTHEVSDVVLGAGVETHTLLVKGKKQGPIDGSWESSQAAITAAAQKLLVPSMQEGWVYNVATFSDRAIVCAFVEGENKYWQFSWALNGDGSVNLSNQTEVELETVIRQKGLTLDAHFARVVVEMSAALERSKAAAAEYKEGRVLSSANRNRLSSLRDALESAFGDIAKILDDTDPEKEKADDEQANKLATDIFAHFLLRDVARINTGESHV